MKSEFMLMAIYEKSFMTFEEICKELGMSKQTGYNLRHKKKFPIAMIENPLRADIRDVAAYLDRQRAEANTDKDRT
jgi:hypothetical protein